MEDVLFYGDFSNFSVASFIKTTGEHKKNQKSIRILANSFGGDSDAGYGFIQTVREYPHDVNLLVHGAAYSMMAFATLYVKEAHCIEQTTFLFHRAASFFEDTPTVLDLVKGRNSHLRKAMEEKIDIEAFERIGGVSLDRMFDSTKPQIDVILNAEQALEIGLVKKVLPLSANEAEEINTSLMAAYKKETLVKVEGKKDKQKVITMDKSELKAKHPALYAQVFEEGENAGISKGVEKEQNRTAAWAVYMEIDAKKATEGIKAGKEISPAETQEFLLAQSKIFAGKSLEEEEKKKAGESDAPEDKSKDDEVLDSFDISVRSNLGLKA